MSEDTLRRIEQKLDELLKIAKATPTGTTTYAQKSVDDSDLDGKYGNPTVRIMAKDWNGQSYAGWNFSDCPPEYLEMHARMLDAFAKKQAADPVKAKYADWSAKDAARARGWAARHRKSGGPTPRAIPDFELDGHAATPTTDPDFPF
jgi:hypothetical protein